MAIPTTLTDREYQKFKESSGVAGQTGLVVVNADGSAIGAGSTSGGAAGSSTSVVGGVYNTTKPTYSNGNATQNQANSRGDLLTSLGTALSQSIDSVLTYPRGANYTNITASTLILTGAGKIRGIFCASSSSGTVKVWDNTSAATIVLVNTFSVAAGTFYNLNDARVSTGIYITVGGTCDITVFFDTTTT